MCNCLLGKIKRGRQKFHIVADKKDDSSLTQKEKTKYKPLQLDAVENIFAGIKIHLDDINKFEDLQKTDAVQNVEKVPEVQEVTKESSLISDKIVTTSKPQKPLTKKEKSMLKHQKLMEKLDVTQKARLQCQKKNKKRGLKSNEQTILNCKSEFQSMLTPSAVKPSGKLINCEKPTKNIFAIPEFNDNLPSLSSVFNLRSNINLEKITNKSKSITKKNNFVKNYNFLKNAMKNKLRK